MTAEAKGAVSNWLRRRNTWQFALIWTVAMAMGLLFGGIIGQLWRHRLDWSVLAGLTVGGAIGGSIAAAWFRQNQQRSLRWSAYLQNPLRVSCTVHGLC